MTIDGNVGADASLLASAADFALANARGQQGGGLTGASLATAAVPSALTAPSSVVVAATLHTSASGLVSVSFDFFFTDSAADTVSVAVQEVPNATAIAGGAV